MSKFNVGDRVIMTHAKRRKDLIGVPTTILRIEACGCFVNGIFRDEAQYILDHQPRLGFSSVCAPGWALKKLGDDYESGSWEEVEKLTNWNPTKVSEYGCT